MPKIPLPNNQRIQHVAAESPLTGGGLQLRYYGDGGTAKAIASGFAKAGSAMMEFAKEYSETENRLAAAEDRALFNQTFEELQLKLADNPGASDEDKEKWINEAQQNYQHERVQYTNRMTAKFRESHDLQMNDLQRAAGNRQLLILNQAKVQRQLDETDMLYKNLCQRGDFEGARALIEENTGTLFNDETAKRFLEHDLPMRQDFYTVSKLAELKPEQAVSLLEETDKEGNHTKYTNLTPESRNSLLRFAKARSAENLTEFTQGYITQINSGTLTETSASLKKKFAEGAISQEQFNMVMPYVKHYEEQNAKNIAAAQQQDIRLKQLRADNAAGAFVYQSLYAADGTKKSYSEAQLAPLRVKLLELCGGSVSLAEKYMPKLNSALAPRNEMAAGSKKTPDFWKTIEGQVIKQKIDDFEDKRFRYDPDGWVDSDDWLEWQKDAHTKRMRLELLEFAHQEFKKNGSMEQTQKAVDEILEKLNDGQVKSILQSRTDTSVNVDINNTPEAPRRGR